MNVLRFKEFVLEHYHPGKEIVIRVATPEEVLDFVENTYAATTSDMNILDLVRLNAEDGHEQHGAFEDCKMLGVVKFGDSPSVEDFTEIHLIYVDPDNRQKEIGKLLMQYVEDNADHKKLITNPYTDEARKFFKKLGFKEDEDIDPNDTNSMIKENDNLNKSISGLNKFGMWDCTELPDSVKKADEEAGFYFEEGHSGLDGFGDKYYTNGYQDDDDTLWITIGMTKSDNGKFDKNSNSNVSVYATTGYNNLGFSILDTYDNYDRVLNFLKNSEEILDPINAQLLDEDKGWGSSDFIEHQIKKSLKNHGLEGHGILIH